MKRFLDEGAASELLEKYGITVLRWKPVKNSDTQRTAWDLGYPIILKIKAGECRSTLRVIASDEEMRTALTNAFEPSSDDCCSLYVQKSPSGKEVCIGFLRIEGYAPAVSLSLGGLFSSILNEFSYASLPVDREAVMRMAWEIGADILLEKGELSKSVDAVFKVARIGVEKKEIIEMDIKLVVHEKLALAVDAGIIVG